MHRSYKSVHRLAVRALALTLAFAAASVARADMFGDLGTAWDTFSHQADIAPGSLARQDNTVVYNASKPDKEVELARVPAEELEGIRLLNHVNVPVKVLMSCSSKTIDEVQDMFAVIREINEQDRLSRRETIKLQLVCDSARSFRKLQVTQADFDKYVEVNRYFKTDDIWMQDWGEIAMASTAGQAEEKLVVFDTNRGRELAELPGVLAKMWSGLYFQKPTHDPGSSGDYGGNIEVTPDDVLYIGDTSSRELRDILCAHGYGDRHAVLNTSWLTVGHVDEFMTTLPNPAAPRGYTILKADPRLGMKLLQGIPQGQLPQQMQSLVQGLFRKRGLHPEGYQGEEGFGREMFQALWSLHGKLNGYEPDMRQVCASAFDARGTRRLVESNEKAAGIIDENIERLKRAVEQATGDTTTPWSVVAVPALFHAFDNDRTVALVPGTANLLSLRDHAVVPDPLLPVFRDATARALAGVGIKPHFVSNASYHFWAGQLHCGTNVLRLPNEYLYKKGHVGARRRLFDKLHR